MSNMRPEIVDEDWFIVETEHGTEYVLCNLFKPDTIGTINHSSENLTEEWSMLLPFLEGRQIHSIERKRSFGARLSAPGYLDCTDWALFDTEEDAIEAMRKQLSDLDDRRS